MPTLASLFVVNNIWYAIGFLGQAIFTGRFIVQWIASERRKESVIPVAFWWMSLFGSWMLLAYAIWRQDPVFTLGQMFGTVVYSRNLMLVNRKKKASEDSSQSNPEPTTLSTAPTSSREVIAMHQSHSAEMPEARRKAVE